MQHGLIYKCVCEESGKCYIGQTTRSLDHRKRQHISNAFRENSQDYNCAFHKALREYTPEKFQWDILVSLQSNTSEELAESLNELEWYYIKKYNAYHDGYNATRGGDSNIVRPARIIILYDIYGEKVEEFDSIDEAAEKTGIHPSTITSTLNKQLPFVKKRYDRHVFRYDGESYTREEIIQNLQKLAPENIYVFDVYGKLIEVCLNLGKFCTKYQVKINSARHCINGERAYVIGDYCPDPLLLSKGSPPKQEIVAYAQTFYNNPQNRSRFFIRVCDLNSSFEKVYPNLSKASKELGLDYRIMRWQLSERKKKEVIIDHYRIINLKYHGS